MFLTPDEVAELTGYQQQSRQVRWLRDRRYPFDLGADGKPRVLRSYDSQRGESRSGAFLRQPRQEQSSA